MISDSIDEMNLIPFAGKPKRVHTSRTPHIQHRSRRLGEIALQNILRSDPFQLAGTLEQAARLVDLGIVA